MILSQVLGAIQGKARWSCSLGKNVDVSDFLVTYTAVTRFHFLILSARAGDILGRATVMMIMVMDMTIRLSFSHSVFEFLIVQPVLYLLCFQFKVHMDLSLLSVPSTSLCLELRSNRDKRYVLVFWIFHNNSSIVALEFWRKFYKDLNFKFII